MPKQSKQHEIQAVWQKHGGNMSVRKLTELCWQEGVWSHEEQRRFAFAATITQCRKALEAKDAAGLPIAGPSLRREGSSPIWIQLAFWDYETAKYNLGRRLRQAEQDYQTIQAIHDYMVMRWGEAPRIPTPDFPPDEPMWWHDPWAQEPDDDA